MRYDTVRNSMIWCDILRYLIYVWCTRMYYRMQCDMIWANYCNSYTQIKRILGTLPLLYTTIWGDLGGGCENLPGYGYNIDDFIYLPKTKSVRLGRPTTIFSNPTWRCHLHCSIALLGPQKTNVEWHFQGVDAEIHQKNMPRCHTWLSQLSNVQNPYDIPLYWFVGILIEWLVIIPM